MTLDLNFVRHQYPVFQDWKTAQWAFLRSAVRGGVRLRRCGRGCYQSEPGALYNTEEEVNRLIEGLWGLF